MAVGEWDQRELCSDGACVGVIGPDGTCKVCGRAAQNWGDERKRGLIDPPDDADDPDALDEDEVAFDRSQGDDLDDEDEDDLDGDDDDEDDLDDDDEDAAEDAADRSAVGVAAAAPAWGARQLCPDGGCIGVIGADGTCKVCGRPAAGAPAASEDPESKDRAP